MSVTKWLHVEYISQEAVYRLLIATMELRPQIAPISGGSLNHAIGVEKESW